MTQWPAPVIRLYLGEITPEALLAAAAKHPDVGTRSDQICEANFYTGVLARQNGRKDEAIRRFRIAASGCPKVFLEWSAANAELRALGVTP